MRTAREVPFEWPAAAMLAVAGITLFGHFEEKTPMWRRLPKWAFYFGVTGLLSRGPGRPWNLLWMFGLPGLGLAFHLWWCMRHGIDPLTAGPKERYYELQGLGAVLRDAGLRGDSSSTR